MSERDVKPAKCQHHYERNYPYNAYYYSFDPTGDDHIDAVLAAVAYAGQMFHHTDSWTDPIERTCCTESVVELIQRVANEAAGVATPARGEDSEP